MAAFLALATLGDLKEREMILFVLPHQGKKGRHF
jgi:hypothetical protein